MLERTEGNPFVLEEMLREVVESSAARDGIDSGAVGRTRLPESVRHHLNSAYATVPVADAPLVTTVIAWPPQSRSRAVADLVRAATRL